MEELGEGDKDMAKMGRPPKEIDKKQFENLCSMQCTLEEITGWFETSYDTIEKFCKKEYGATFSKVFTEKRAGGKISLRRSQFRLAERNAAMAIWLGKQYLGQTDKPEDNIDTEDSEAYFTEAGIE